MTRLGVAYLAGAQGPDLGPGSVACTAKHFPGGGPVRGGEDSHFPYGQDQVYPSGSQEAHLAPFPAAVAAGVAAVMPYYSKPVGLRLGGMDIEEVGFGYNRQVVTSLLREQLGFEGVVVSDWELINDNHVGDQVLPARAWGVEHLDPHERMERLLEAGCDQFGGEECVEVLAALVADGRVAEARVDESVRRLLTVKFRLGLFDDPYVDEEMAESVVGRADFVAAGLLAQAASVTVLADAGLLPLDEAAGAAGGSGAGGDAGDAAGRFRPPGLAPRVCRWRSPPAWVRSCRRRRAPTWPSCASPHRSTRATTSSWRRGSTRVRSTSRPGCR